MQASQAFRYYTHKSRLRSIYDESVSTRRAAGRDGKRPRDLRHDLDSELALISDRLRGGNYRFTAFKELLKSKGARKYPRILSIPTARDRVAIKAISTALASAFDIETSELAPWKISRLKAVISEERFDAFIRIDVENFYPSINHAHLIRALRTKVRSSQVLAAVQAVIATPTIPAGQAASSGVNDVGVPQGLSISNVLAEIYLKGLDSYFEGRPDLAYFRYVDDILVICDAESQEQIDAEIRKRLAAIALSAHPAEPGAKSQIGRVSDGFSYLGFQFSGSAISVRDASIRTLEESLVRHFVRYRRQVAERQDDYSKVDWDARQLYTLQWMLNLTITGCVIDGSRWGWLHYFSAANDYGIVARLDHLVAGLRSRFDLTDRLVVKSFRSSYWALKYPGPRRAGYIPNFDDMPASEFILPLATVFWIPVTRLASMDDEALRALFLAKMRPTLQRLEHDIGHLS